MSAKRVRERALVREANKEASAERTEHSASMNPKQEILDEMDYLDVVQRHIPIVLTDCILHIRAIMEAHTLEPIDTRPFDPTLVRLCSY